MFDNLTREWKHRVYDQEEEVDPSGEHDWRSLAVGFGLGNGLSPEEADNFYNHLLSLNCV